MLRSQYVNSSTSWSNPQFDELLALGGRQATTDEANVYFNQAQEILLAELPAIPLWYTYKSTIISTSVTGVLNTLFVNTGNHLYQHAG